MEREEYLDRVSKEAFNLFRLSVILLGVFLPILIAAANFVSREPSVVVVQNESIQSLNNTALNNTVAPENIESAAGYITLGSLFWLISIGLSLFVSHEARSKMEEGVDGWNENENRENEEENEDGENGPVRNWIIDRINQVENRINQFINWIADRINPFINWIANRNRPEQFEHLLTITKFSLGLSVLFLLFSMLTLFLGPQAVDFLGVPLIAIAILYIISIIGMLYDPLKGTIIAVVFFIFLRVIY